MVIKNRFKPAQILFPQNPCCLRLNLSVSVTLKHAYLLPHIPGVCMGGSPH